MAALEQPEDDFEANVWNLLRPMEGQHGKQLSLDSTEVAEVSTPRPPHRPSQLGPARQLLGAKQFHTFLETGDPEQALNVTPTSTPSSRKSSVGFFSHYKILQWNCKVEHCGSCLFVLTSGVLLTRQRSQGARPQ